MTDKLSLLPETAEQELFWTVFRTSSDLMAITSAGERKHLAVNDAWLQTMHYTAEEVVGRTGIEIGIWPGYEIRPDIEAAIATGKAFTNLPTVMRTKDNRLIHCVLTGKPVILNGEQVWLFSSRDVTLKKLADDALSDLQTILIDALESINEGFVLYGPDGGLIVCNSKFREFYGYTDEEARFGAHRTYLGQLDVERRTVIVNGRDESKYVNRREDLIAGPPKSFEVQLRDGRILMLSDRKTSSGGVVSIQSDITHERKMEEALRRSQKMEAVGQLTGGIAHDFNNILNVILGNLELIEELAESSPETEKLTEAALRSVHRGSDITKKLLSFARKETAVTKRISVNELVRDIQGLIARSLTASIEVCFQPDNELWDVEIDPGDLEDALLNLSLNARDAMPDGGILSIRTTRHSIHNDSSRTDLPLPAGDYVKLSISDSGTGMAKSIRDRALEPFFTTKDQGKGTGLGLSMVYGFTERSGGHISLHSEPGLGTTVNLYLPRAKGIEITEKPHSHATQDKGGEEKILIVDDEAALLEVASSILAKQGYEILKATSGQEALALLQGNPDTDLLFTDVIMPGGLDGFQLAAKARKLFPDLKILMASGYTRFRESPDSNDYDTLRNLSDQLLQKPYSRSILTSTVRKTLDGVS